MASSLYGLAVFWSCSCMTHWFYDFSVIQTIGSCSLSVIWQFGLLTCLPYRLMVLCVWAIDVINFHLHDLLCDPISFFLVYLLTVVIHRSCLQVIQDFNSPYYATDILNFRYTSAFDLLAFLQRLNLIKVILYIYNIILRFSNWYYKRLIYLSFIFCLFFN